ncbi:hypothetical protein B5K11_14025 [Rhizobium leguminosarum bv. trifolii]|nr:hypothetical protein B5K11_14025 [Rhizobium leguminosarum bv. trifolii]
MVIPVKARCASTMAVAGFRPETVNAPLEPTQFHIHAALPKAVMVEPARCLVPQGSAVPRIDLMFSRQDSVGNIG